jgi:hypothetical protein
MANAHLTRAGIAKRAILNPKNLGAAGFVYDDCACCLLHECLPCLWKQS